MAVAVPLVKISEALNAGIPVAQHRDRRYIAPVAAPDSPALAPPAAADRFVEESAARLWPGSQVAKPTAVPGDASSRRYFRYLISNCADAPATVVVMVMEDAAIALSSDELGVFGEDGPEELAFLNVARFLAPRTSAIPEIYASADDNSLVMLEDVGDVPLWEAATAPKGNGPAATEDYFRAALDALAELQERSSDDGTGCYAFRQAFDERLFGWELEHFLEYGVAGADPTLMDAARAELTALAGELGRLPRVFCHRDYHAWNIHWHEGRVRIIDFQDALLAPAVYDVASLLTDRVTPTGVDPQMEARLVEYYFDQQTAGRLSSLAATKEAYARCALQRVLKVVGRFNYLADVKGKTGYAQMLPTVAANARRLVESMENLDATQILMQQHARDGVSH